jgi:hypothetical protein
MRLFAFMGAIAAALLLILQPHGVKAVTASAQSQERAQGVAAGVDTGRGEAKAARPAEEKAHCHVRTNQVCMANWNRDRIACEKDMQRCGRNQGDDCRKRQQCQISGAECLQAAASIYASCLKAASMGEPVGR